MPKFKIGIKRVAYNHKLRDMRLKMNLTQKHAGAMIGINSSTYATIERIEKSPNQKQAQLIADFFDVDATVLFPQWTTPIYGTVNKYQEVLVEKVALESKEVKQLTASQDIAYNILKDDMTSDTLSLIDNVLSDREANLIRYRFGISHENTHTLEETGKKFGITRERVRQIEAKAIRRLKHPAKRKRLDEYLNY